MRDGTFGREYRYQVDYTIRNRMYHVRCDDWLDFKEAVKNLEDDYITTDESQVIPPIKPTLSANPATPAIGCEICGQALLPEKRIVSKKDGRAWWIRDCSSGDRSHKGLIRPAT